jgi:hypothetical protein
MDNLRPFGANEIKGLPTRNTVQNATQAFLFRRKQTECQIQSLNFGGYHAGF